MLLLLLPLLLQVNGNPSAARALMQQGLRMCRHSQKMWLDYFDMVSCCMTVIERHMVHHVARMVCGGRHLHAQGRKLGMQAGRHRIFVLMEYSAGLKILKEWCGFWLSQ